MAREADRMMLAGVIQLAQYLIWLLVRAPEAPADESVGVVLDLPEYEEPEAFLANRALSQEAEWALRAAREGRTADALDGLSSVATLSSQMPARWIANTIRTAFYIHPAVAQAALDKTREILAIA